MWPTAADTVCNHGSLSEETIFKPSYISYPYVQGLTPRGSGDVDNYLRHTTCCGRLCYKGNAHSGQIFMELIKLEKLSIHLENHGYIQ